ncbi:hypothetical protein ACEN8I_20190 [Polaromonas sp. CT11-55]|uniref:hypothetical protein n=1 Tax=Polaromonas sp. CT11-55 TaxID=3243045 RepID=UPI0039A651F8
MQIGAAIYPGLICIALALPVLPALGQDIAPVPAADTEPPPPPVVAPVLYAYATLASTRSVEQSCWQVLIPEREYLVRQNNAKPWLLRNAVPLIGAAMGGFTGGFLLKRHATAAVYKRWAVPVIVGSAGAGFVLGPGGVTGAVVGGAIGDKLGKHKPAITAVSMIGGALAGKALWDMVFPPAVPPEPPNGPDDDIPVEVFLRDQQCGARLQTAHNQSVYRVGYRFNDEERVAELPYDPGEALLVSASGEVTGPARKRID